MTDVSIRVVPDTRIVSVINRLAKRPTTTTLKFSLPPIFRNDPQP